MTENAPQAANGNCACLCGNGLNHPRSNFLQGHDQRFVGVLAQDAVDGTLTNARVEQLQLPAEVDEQDIQERINLVDSAVTRFFSPALAAKFVSAAHRRWDKVIRDSQPKGQREPKAKTVNVERAVVIAEDMVTKPPMTLDQAEQEYAVVLGAPIKVKVGRWQYEATVHGMSQAGKVTAVRYESSSGKELVKTEGQFTII